MGDLYGNSGAIALGNMRTKMVRDMNEKVKSKSCGINTRKYC